MRLAPSSSVTTLGDLLDFGQLFKAFWQQLICPNLPHSKAIFVKVLKSISFLVKSFLGKFCRHLAIFFWSHCPPPRVIFSLYALCDHSKVTLGKYWFDSICLDIFWPWCSGQLVSCVLSKRDLTVKRKYIANRIFSPVLIVSGTKCQYQDAAPNPKWWPKLSELYNYLKLRSCHC